MTNREVVAIIRSKLKQISGDDVISDRAILAELKSTANLFIKREVDRRRLLAVDSLFTTIPCLEMIEVPLTECCAYKNPCTIRRSKEKIPKVGEGLWGYIIETVQSMDGSIKFTEGTATRYVNALNLNLKKKPNFYWVHNRYLYVSDPDIEYVMLRAYFEEEVDQDFMKCDSTSTVDDCKNPLDNEFKCPGYLTQNVISAVETGYANIFMRLKTDQTDDDNEGT